MLRKTFALITTASCAAFALPVIFAGTSAPVAPTLVPLAPSSASAPASAPVSVSAPASAPSSAPGSAPAVPTLTKPEPAVLADLENRGRFLADYDRVAWVASDRLLELKPDRSLLGTFFALKIADRWFVFFGKFDYNQDTPTFHMAYIFSAPVDHPDRPERVSGEPPAALKENHLLIVNAGLAFEVAGTAAKELFIAEHYNAYVYPEPDGSYSVYFMPAQTDRNTVPLGGDFIIRVSADGKHVTERRKLHKSIIPFDVRKTEHKAGATVDYAMH